MVDLVRALKRKGFRGPVVGPRDPAYQNLRKICNAAIDQHPSVIARCLNKDDISIAVLFARKHKLELAARGGGHQVTGYGLDAGQSLLLDTRLMKRVSMRKVGNHHIARIHTGALWGDVDQHTLPRGFAAVGGENRYVGAIGYTLGGGYGYLSRNRGMACDTVRSLEVINADGECLLVNRRRHQDLFWAMRGAGMGNFGITARLDLEVKPIRPKVFTASLLWPLKNARAVIQTYQQLHLNAPNTLCLNLEIGILNKIDFVVVTGMFDGPANTGSKLIKPLLDLKPAKQRVRTESYAKFQSMDGDSAGLAAVWKTGYPAVKLMPESALEIMVEYSRKLPVTANGSLSGLEPLGGKINDVAPDGTAFVHRQALWNFDIFAFWNPASPKDGELVRKWAQDYYADMQPYLSGSVYQNYPDADLPDWADAYYGSNLDRLRNVKCRYDPDRVFGHMQGL